ncbi:MAG: hypothetical protein RDV41_12415, partial [Planctomycetota bacterium]|nr:hypothetical protein [Planctomycetota bacterium]
LGTEFGALAHRDSEWKAVYAKAGTGGAIAMYTDGEVNMMNGSVGIGTTSPTAQLHLWSDDPTQVNDDIIINENNNWANSEYHKIAFKNSTVTTVGRIGVGFPAAGSVARFVVSDLYNAGNQTVDHFVVQADSNVGIGTASPSARLDILGSPGKVTLSTAAGAAPAAGTVLGQLAARNSSYAADSAYINAVTESTWSGGDYPTALAFLTTADGAAAPTERMRIMNSGNVGIGTTSPGNKLVVDVGANDVMKITRDNTVSITHIAKLLFANRYGGGENVLARIGIADGLGNKGLLIFEVKENTTFPDSTTVEKMRIQYDGNVGIGTNAPGTRLEVYSDNTGPTTAIYGRKNGTGQPLYGVSGFISGGTAAVMQNAVRGYASITAGDASGVYGGSEGANPAGTNIGVYGTASNALTNWAGYFSGNVNITGTLTVGGTASPYVLRAGDTMTGDLNMGTDGAGKKIFLAAQDAGSEGGEMTLNGSGANADWNFDNYGGRLRLHSAGTSYFDLYTTGLLLGNDMYFREDNSPTDPGYPWYRSDSGYAIFNSSYGVNGTNNYGLMLNWDNSDDISLCQGGGYVSIGAGAATPGALLEVRGQARAASLYDYNDTGYYVDPNSTSNVITVVGNRLQVRDNGQGNAYLTTELGSLPGYPANYYPTLKSDSATIYFSLSGAYSGYFQDTGMRARAFYDFEDNNYYVDPNGGTSAVLAGNVGVGASPSYRLHVTGSTSSTLAYAYNSYNSGAAGEQSSIYGYLSSGQQGSNYGVYSSRAATKGYAFYGYGYTFGVAGYRFDDAYNRTGGVFGGSSSADPPTAWGSLGYRNSAGSHYGAYWTSSGSGGGFLGDNVQTGIGSGGYGGVMGGWVRGEVLGFTAAGELYASYNVGNEYTSGVQADIVTLPEKRVAVYANTSTDVKVYADGIAQLSDGTCEVKFAEAFAEVISKDSRPTVAITSLAECEGLFITNIDASGFIVKEAQGGTSAVEFTWIAIAKRVDHRQTPELPQAIADAKFDDNLRGVMFNESNTDRSATPIWWDGSQLRYDSPPPQPPTQKVEPPQPPAPADNPSEVPPAVPPGE